MVKETANHRKAFVQDDENQKTAASYIWDKGHDLGLRLDAAVETGETADGIPVPWSVTVEGEFSQEVAAWIAEELGIPRERQVWHEGEN